MFGEDLRIALLDKSRGPCAPAAPADLRVRMVRIEPQRSFDQVRIERAGETFVAGKEQQFDPLLFTLRQQRIRTHFRIALRGGCQIGQHVVEQFGVRPGRDHPLLRAPQLCRRDHLHGPRDLLRVLDRADSPPDVDETRHGELRLGCRGRLRFSPTNRCLKSLIDRVQVVLQLVVQNLLFLDRRPDRRLGIVDVSCTVQFQTRGSARSADRR